MFGIKKDKDKIDVPVQAVISMKERGLTNEQIIDQLKSQGYSLQQIRDALTQASVKEQVVKPSLTTPQQEKSAEPPLPELPSTKEETTTAPIKEGPGLNETPVLEPPKPPEKKTTGVSIEEIERILEEIVDERWKNVTNKINEYNNTNIKQEERINALEKRVNELSKRVDEISNAVMIKVDEYNKTMDDVNVEIKALEKVMEKLVPSMAEQIKELKSIVGSIKSKPLNELD